MSGEVVGGACTPGRSGCIAAAPCGTAALLFVIIFSIYLFNPDPVWSGDMNSNSIFAFNIFEFHTVYLDAYANGYLAKSFGMHSFYNAAPGTWAAGHIVAGYPIGAALVTLPLYALFYVYMKLFAPAVSFTTADFEPYRIAFLHISAAFLSAATIVLFFLLSRARFSDRVALITSVCLAVATIQWGFLSQSMMQHGPSSFTVLVAAYLLVRADRSTETRVRTLLLLVAGGLAGLLFLIRPTNLVFTFALFVLVLIWFKRASYVFAIGLAITGGMTLVWNFADFGSMIGPSITQLYQYNFSIETFFGGLVGLLLSPNRGVIPNSPFLLFAIVAAIPVARRVASALLTRDLRKTDAPELLFCALLGASVVLLLNYAMSPFWSGGFYGNRYMSETIPFIAYFLNYLPILKPEKLAPLRIRVLVTIFALFVGIGVFNQVTAIVGGHRWLAEWNSTPVSDIDTMDDRRWAYLTENPLRTFETRAWNFRDSLPERIWRGVYNRNFVFPMTGQAAGEYASKCAASIVNVEGNDQKQPNTFEVRAILRQAFAALTPAGYWSSFNDGRKFVRAKVKNTGTVPLFGFETGLTWGRSSLVHQVTNQSGAKVYENGTIHISGVIYPGETGDALGSMEVPLPPGRYGIDFRVAVNGIGYCGLEHLPGTLIVVAPFK
jgi:hypothetical protein